MIGWSCTQVLVPLCFSFSEAAIHAWPKVLYVTVFAPHLSRRVNLLHCMAYPLYQTLSWLFRSGGRCLAGILDKLVASCCCLSGKPSSPAPLFSPLSQPLRSLGVDEDVRLYLTQTFARVRVNVKQNKTNKTTKRTLTQMSTTNTRETLDCRSFNSVVVPDDFIQTELGYEVEHGVLSRDGKRYCCFVCFLENVVLSLHWNWRLWKEVPGLLELPLIDETRAEQVTTQAS